VEGFAKYATGRYENFFDSSTKEKYSAVALGLSLGKKWINHTGFVFEPILGVGRTIGNDNATPEAIVRLDLNIGYRF